MADEILSQEEIDALLEVVDDSQESDEARIKNDRAVSFYDFRRPNRISKDQLRAISSIHDKFARLLSPRISSLVKGVVNVKPQAINQMSYGEFISSLPNPTNFNVFSLEPLDGNFVLEFAPNISFAVLDKILGGKGESYKIARELTDIEQNLFDSLLKINMNLIKESWSEVIDFVSRIEAKESNPNAVQIVLQNETVLVVAFEITIGLISGLMHICYPILSLEGILGILGGRDLSMNEISNKKTRNKELRGLVGRSEIVYEALLGKTMISVDEFLELKQGDILKLDKEADDKAIITIDNKELFYGQIGLHRFKKSVRILKLIRTDKGEIKEILKKYEDERKLQTKNESTKELDNEE